MWESLLLSTPIIVQKCAGEESNNPLVFGRNLIHAFTRTATNVLHSSAHLESTFDETSVSKCIDTQEKNQSDSEVVY